MANNKGTLINSTIRPQHSGDTFAIAFAEELKGGHHQVADIIARDNISVDRRVEGMLCSIIDSGLTYQLVGGLDNSNWVEYTDELSQLSYFHALGKALTTTGETINEASYKSAHNVRSQEIWIDNVGFASGTTDADTEASGNMAVTKVLGATLTIVPGSNGQAYYLNSGGTFVRPWIAPEDISDPITNLPSSGYTLQLNRVMGNNIIPNDRYFVNYYSGIIYFRKGRTPTNMGWGDIKGTFYRYSGRFLSDISDGNIISTGLTNLQGVNTTGTTLGYGRRCIDNLVLPKSIEGSLIQVFLNGVLVPCGDSFSDDVCFFASNTGTETLYSNARAQGDQQQYDTLYWKANADYQIDVDDIFDIVVLV